MSPRSTRHKRKVRSSRTGSPWPRSRVIAALAALLIAAQAIARQLRAGRDDLQVLRALGAGPAMTAADGLTGILGAVVAGSLLAVGVAVALSPIAPIGPVRPVYPSPGVAFDWTVLGLGFVALVGVLGTVAVVLALRGAPRRGTGPATLTVARGSGAARLAAVSGLPAPAVAGIHFAFDPGKGRNTVPARSAISGTVLAVVMRGGHPDLWQQPVDAGLASIAVRMELDLRPVRGTADYSAIPQQQVGSRLARQSGRRGLDQGLLRHCRPGRAGRSRAVRQPARRAHASHPVRASG